MWPMMQARIGRLPLGVWLVIWIAATPVWLKAVALVIPAHSAGQAVRLGWETTVRRAVVCLPAWQVL